MEKEYLWEIEHVIFMRGIIFIYGWCCHKIKLIDGLELHLVGNTETGESLNKIISVAYSKPRPDLGRRFSEYSHIDSSGFIVYSRCELVAIDHAELIVHIENKMVCSIPLNIDFNKKIDKMTRIIDFIISIRTYAYKALNLVLDMNFKLLKAKLKSYKKRSILGVYKSKKNFYEKVNQLKDIPTILIIDHQLGGGANFYRQRLVQKRIEMDQNVLIMTFNVLLQEYVLSLQTEHGFESCRQKDKDGLCSTIELLNVDEIFFNNAVSYPNPEILVQVMLFLKFRKKTLLSMVWHDFYLLCPSHFLLNNRYEFCGIPDISVCSRCLSCNKNDFVSLLAEKDILNWRKIWTPFVDLVDKHYFGDGSTYEIAKKVYVFNLEKVMIQPHDMTYFKKHPVSFKNNKYLHIGVVGRIGIHKGSKIIQQMAEEIVKSQLNIRIIIIGLMDGYVDKRVVTQLGEYAQNDLPDLIESSGVNMMLLPSIYPETFSYVLEELMLMNLPVAAFPLGAQGEKVKKYRSGLVLKSFEGKEILLQMMNFFYRLCEHSDEGFHDIKSTHIH